MLPSLAAAAPVAAPAPAPTTILGFSGRSVISPAPPASPSSTAASSATTSGSSTASSATAASLPPTTTSGVPPTPAPASPGLPVPLSGSGLPSTVPTSPQAQTLRPQIGLTPAQVADVQSLLAGQGLYAGSIDGVMSGATRGGIRAFQLAAGLPATGLLDAATASALGVASPAQAAAIFGTPFPLSGVGQNPASLFIQP